MSDLWNLIAAAALGLTATAIVLVVMRIWPIAIGIFMAAISAAVISYVELVGDE